MTQAHPTKRESLAPIALTVHPLLTGMPEWADDSEEFSALCRDISARGIDYALKVTAKNQIADGRNRWRAAKQLKLDSIPVERIDEDQVLSVVLSSICHRRHYSKGALAYMTTPLLAKGRNRSLDLIAGELGIGTRLLEQAKALRGIFESGPEGAEYQTKMEPAIFSGDVGLGAVLAGWGGRSTTKGLSKKTVTALEIWSRSLTDLGKRFSSWDKFDLAAKNTVTAHWTSLVEQMPNDLLAKITAKVRTEARRRNAEI